MTMGVILGVVVLLWAYILGRDFQAAIIVSTSLVLVSILGSLSGGALPFIFRLMKIDPALVSAPVISTIMDVLGLGIYFLVANIVLRL